MPLQMGVEAIRIDADAVGAVRVAAEASDEPPVVPEAEDWFAFSAEMTRSFQAVNRLLALGVSVSRAETEDGPVFLVPASDGQALGVLRELAAEIGIQVTADPEGIEDAEAQASARVGVYQGWAAAMDEGWTRLVLEDFEFGFESLSNEDVRTPDLRDRLDVILIPAEISLNRLIRGSTSDATPPEFRGGIGDEGVENLKEFVRAGGTLITLDQADQLVIEHFGVPVRNAASGLSQQDFYLPSSLLRVELDPEHPIAAGSPTEVAAKWAGGRAYEPTGFDGEAGKITAVGRWATDPDRVLMSGLLHGAEHLAGKAAILDVEYGEGRILMYGFRVQHRAQTHGTFKLLFNALISAIPRPTTEG
jgi:hypothetical protein